MGRKSRDLDVSRMTSKGQITVPKKVRVAFGLKVGDDVLFRIEGKKAIISKGERMALSAILAAQGAWEEESVHFQRRLRKEWPE